MTAPKRLARIAGVLYLLVGIFGGFALSVVYPSIYVAGDAAKTAGNVGAHAGLLRAGVVADLFQATVWIFLALALHRLLAHVHEGVAGGMVTLAAVGAGITCLNAVFAFAALRAGTGAVDLSSLGAAGSNALVLLLVDAHHFGFFIAEIFFGLWLAPLGYLAYRSGWFPKALGILLVVACICYLADMFAAFLLPGVSTAIHRFVLIPSGIAEVWMVGYLLVIGVRSGATAKPGERILAAA